MLEEFFAHLGPSVTGAGSVTSLPLPLWAAAAKELARAGLWLHVDLMDGVFTPRAGVPVDSLGWLKAGRSGRLDFHLMVERPDEVLPDVLDFNPDRVTVHIERLSDAGRTASTIRLRGASPWLALSPESSPEIIGGTADLFDGVLVMLVNPGSSEAADLGMVGKLEVMRRTSLLGVDGGVTAENLSLWVASGASYIVVGRALFGTL